MAAWRYERWDRTPGPDFEAMVERHPGMVSGCWCCKFHEGRPDGWLEGESNKDFKRRLVMDGVAHAALVYEGDEAVAWAEYGTPEELPGLHHDKQYLGPVVVWSRATRRTSPTTTRRRRSTRRSSTTAPAAGPRAGFTYVRPQGINHCVMTRTVTPLS